MATMCDSIRSQLTALEEKLNHTPKYLEQPSQGASQSKLNPEWVNLDSHLRRTRLSLQVCEGNRVE